MLFASERSDQSAWAELSHRRVGAQSFLCGVREAARRAWYGDVLNAMSVLPTANTAVGLFYPFHSSIAAQFLRRWRASILITIARKICALCALANQWNCIAYPCGSSSWSSGLWPRATRFCRICASRLRSIWTPVATGAGALSRKILPMW